MEKRRTVKKKVEMASQEPSSSSKKNRKRTLDKMENGQKEKKLKKESKAKVHKSSINDLPPEMLMKVLKHLSVRNLLDCRHVNRKWNEIASEILQSRPDLELQFNSSINNKGSAEFLFEDEERKLLDLIKCFKKSKNFPFAHFYFREIDSSSFDQKDWIKFISDLGKNVRGLKLSIKSTISKDGDLIKLTEKVRDLLLSKLPELEKFGLQFRSREIPNSSTIPLFPTSSENPKSKTTIRLPHLKVLYLDEFMFSEYIGIATDLLCASVNLQKLETFEEHGKYKYLDNFKLLQSLGKLGCLQAAKIEPVQLLSKNFEENALSPSQFKLRALNLNSRLLHRGKKHWSETSVFLSNLFENSKDTLSELKIDPLGFLDDLQLPKFSQLICLSTYGQKFVYWKTRDPEPLFPSGINHMETFPVLRSLDLKVPWSKLFPNEDDISSIPTLEILRIIRYDEMNKTTIAQISLLCPNLKEFEICDEDYRSPLRNFPEIGRAIWTHLKKLRYLELYVTGDGRGDAFPAFDSCISGFSNEDCVRLYDLLLADQLLRKHGSRGKVPKSELKAERKFPSILDLEDLVFFKLDVLCCYPDRDCYPDTEPKIKPDLTKIGPTDVSERCTLHLMENLLDYDIDKKVEYYETD